MCEEAPVPSAARRESGWRCLEVEGTLDFGQVGVLEGLARPLARAGIPIFVLSTFDTDHVFLKGDSLERGVRALEAAGHRVLGVPTGRRTARAVHEENESTGGLDRTRLSF